MKLWRTLLTAFLSGLLYAAYNVYNVVYLVLKQPAVLKPLFTTGPGLMEVGKLFAIGFVVTFIGSAIAGLFFKDKKVVQVEVVKEDVLKSYFMEAPKSE